MYLKLKRTFDFVFSFLLLIILLPFFLIIALMIKIDSRGPVFFKQKRYMSNKRLFYILKFRTMRIDAPRDSPTHLLEEPDKWITNVGRILRKTSLDELPQIINIFKGEMSFIGPRPALWNQYDLIEKREKYKANDVPVGLTGWAQINGRDELEIKTKAKLDGEYSKKIGSIMDIRCFFGTFLSVIRRSGVQEGKIIKKTQSKMQKECKLCNLNAFSNKKNVTFNYPKVSIIVPTYRRKKTLRNALQSLNLQTYPNLEIIVIDDNANAEWNTQVEKIVKNVKVSKGNQIIYINNKINKGSAKTRNIGIKQASGDYITFLDDDDIYLPNKVKKQVEHMVKKNSDFSLTDLWLYDEKDKLIEKRIRNYITDFSKENLIKHHLMYHLTGTNVMMFKTEYLLDIGMFSPIDIGDEFYLMLKALDSRGTFSYLPGCEVKSYVHIETEGLSNGDGKIKGEKDLYLFKKKYFNILTKKEQRYIKMRHYAVLAFAELRRKKYFNMGLNICLSFISSPKKLLILIVNRKLKK